MGTFPAEWSASVRRPPCRPPRHAWAALLLPRAQGLPRARHTQHTSLGEQRWGPSGHSHSSFPLLPQGSIKDTAFGSTTSQRTTITTMTARSTSSVSVRTLPPPVCGTGDGRQAGAGGRIGPVSAKGPVSGCSRHSPLTQDTEFRGWGMVRPAVTCRSPPCSYWLRGHTSSGLARGRRGGVPLPGAATSCCLQRS